jgi:UDP-GlcNAc:undecaprenyl-phosphate GlcNAc-1-phosphate transferase
MKAGVGLAVVGGAVVLHIMGLIDDHRPLSASIKLLVQFAVALVLTAGFGVRAGQALGPLPATVLTTLWIVGLTNAFNFMDNMDGLSAGVAALTSIILAVTAALAGQLFVPCLLLLVAGAVAGFLIYNFPPASVFMGDAGSLVVGYLLAVLTVLTTFYSPALGLAPFGVLVPIVVFAVPLYDMASVMVHRYRAGASVFRGDRRHFSRRLVKLGMSPTSAVLTIYLATTATSLSAILIPRLDWQWALLVFGQCIAVVAIIAILESRDVK